MAPLDDTTGETRFDSFDVYRTSYKTIGSHNIDVGILIPKDIRPGKHPLAVKFHGGGLITGDCLFAPWFSAYYVPFLHRNAAITVLPNYRLTPEASGADILADLSDFWTWLMQERGLDRFLAQKGIGADVDYARLFVTGDSAGGYMALQSALTRPSGEIRVVQAQYPMTNVLAQSLDAPPFGQVPPSEAWLDEYLRNVEPGAVCSSFVPTEAVDRSLLSGALGAYRRFHEVFGTGKRLWPVSAVEGAEGLPPIAIFHGRRDSVVSVGDSEVFVEKVRGLFKDVEIRLAVRDGDHGFDIEAKEDEEEWLKTELEWIEGKWLA